MRQTWIQVMQGLEEELKSRTTNVISAMLRAAASVSGEFFRWYVPALDAFGLVMGRAHEYDADRCAAEITSAATAAQSLVNLELLGAFASQIVWPGIYEQGSSRPEAPDDFVLQIERAFRSGPPVEFSHTALKALLASKTSPGATHPCCADRLRALGFAPPAEDSVTWLIGTLPVGRGVTRSAAEHYLRNSGGAVGETVMEWRKALTGSFHESWEKVRQAKAKEEELRAKQAEGPLTDDEALALAINVEWRSDDEALSMLRTLAEQRPENGWVRFHLARILLRMRRPEGLPLADSLVSGPAELARAACVIVLQHLDLTDPGNANRPGYEKRLQEVNDFLQNANAERQVLMESDVLLPHELDEPTIAKLQSLCAEYPDLEAAYVVRKQVRHRTESPCFIVGLLPKRSPYASPRWYRGDSQEGAELLEMVKWIEVPGSFLAVVLTGPHKIWLKRMTAVPGAEVYSGEIQLGKAAAATGEG
jgi:hypothetical protein